MESLPTINGIFSIIIVLLIGYSTSETTTLSPTEEIYEKYENNECFHKYNVTIEMRYYGRHGKFPEEIDYKCFTKCLFRVYDMIDDNGAIREDMLLANIPHRDMKYFHVILDNCLPQSDKLEHKLGTCESIFEFIKCCYNISPILIDYLPI